MDYLPEYGSMGLHHGHVGLYRLFSNQSWRQVCDKSTRKPIIHSSSGDAIKAAKDAVRKLLNPELKHGKQQTAAETNPEPEDLLGIEEWRKGKQGEYAVANIIRNSKSKKMVVVERNPKGRSRDQKSK